MKRLFFALGFVCLFASNLYSQKPVLKLSKYLFNITNYKATPEPNFTLRDGLNGNTAGTIFYTVKGVEHIISTPSQDTVNQPTVHFIKKNGAWVFENFYENAKLHAVRNYCQLDTLGTIAFAEDDDMSFGNLWICKTSGDSLIWQKFQHILRHIQILPQVILMEMAYLMLSLMVEYLLMDGCWHLHKIKMENLQLTLI